MIVKSKTPFRIFLVTVFAAVAVLLGILALLFSTHSLKIDSFDHFVITDARENGFSEARLVSSAPYNLEFRLRSGAPSPYAGVSFRMQNAEQALKNDFFDFSDYDSLCIKVSSGRMPRMTIRMVTFDPRVTRLELPYTARPVERIVESSGAEKEVRLALSEFKVPERWFSSMGFDSPDPFTFLTNGLRFEVLTAHGAMLGIPDEFSFAEAELYGTNHVLLKFLLWAGIAWAVLFVIALFAVNKKLVTVAEAEHAKSAQELLKQKGLSHTEIALRAGFKNLKECKRVYAAYFKKEFGRG